MTSSAAREPARFVVVLPIKPPHRGKSRLGEPASRRRELAAAFALDTAAAAVAAQRVSGVLAATDDHRFAERLRALGCDVVPDAVDDDLNTCLHQGALEARRRWPDAVPVGLVADLPALRSDDLDEALASVGAPQDPWFVADAEGTGTTLYLAPTVLFTPAFGLRSAERHAELGARAVGGALRSLRRDVDDLDELDEARALGLGRHTSALLA